MRRCSSLFEITDVAVARRPQDRPAAGARAAEAGARAAAQQPGRSTSRRWRRCSPTSTQVNAHLLAQAGKVGTHLRDNEWLMAIKQRAAIPGGVCEFDLPAYHYWLNQDPATRRRDLAGWIEPFEPIRAGLGDRAAPAARERPHQPAHRVSRRVPADADDDEGRAAPAAHARSATCRACPRSAPTSTRSTSASSACPAWTAATSSTRTSSSS